MSSLAFQSITNPHKSLTQQILSLPFCGTGTVGVACFHADTPNGVMGLASARILFPVLRSVCRAFSFWLNFTRLAWYTTSSFHRSHALVSSPFTCLPSCLHLAGSGSFIIRVYPRRSPARRAFFAIMYCSAVSYRIPSTIKGLLNHWLNTP